MKVNIIGCDWHSRHQVVAWVDLETGEIRTRRLEHENEETRAFDASWPRRAVVGIEATFPALWFERLLAECGHQLWVGDAARIRASVVREQKTDTRDAEHLLDLLLAGGFPRTWVPSLEERRLRQLLAHRLKLVRTPRAGTSAWGRSRSRAFHNRGVADEAFGNDRTRRTTASLSRGFPLP